MKTGASAGIGVLLVVPPFRSVVRPALGASLLRSALRREGFGCEVLYANLRFADRIGVHLYESLAGLLNLSPGDFLFSCVRFGRPRQDIERYVDEMLLPSGEASHLRKFSSRRGLVDTLGGLVREARAFLEEAADEIIRRGPRLVGFTSSYQENLASVALARRLKEKAPEILTVMGGANCAGEMGEELLRQFTELDFVGRGECDRAMVELARALEAGDVDRPVEGILARGPHASSPVHATVAAEDLDRLPVPDFDDYFGQLAAYPWRRRLVAGLVMESSRGCWWGARHHCRFCGLNGEQFAFRSKSPARFRDEMTELTRRHGIRRMEMVDNIVDPRFFRELFPGMAGLPKVDQFWETSGCLSGAQVRALAQGGTTHIQAGIESLSERSLRLMDKPTTRLKNIETLKRCAESGIRVLWSHLFGIPGESEEEIGEIARIVESIHHLAPAFSAHLIRLQRFSPYFEASNEYGFGLVEPAACYRHLYPFADLSVARLAFHFDSEFSRAKGSGEAFARMRSIVSRWRRSHWRSHLVAVRGRRGGLVIDTRSCAKSLFFRPNANQRQVLDLCDRAKDMPAILAAVSGGMTREEVEGALSSLVERRVMLHADGRYLSLTTAPGARRGKGEDKMPGGHLHPMGVLDLVGAWRRRTGLPWVLSAYLTSEMPLTWLKRWNRIAARLLRAIVGGAEWCAGRWLGRPAGADPCRQGAATAGP